MPDTGLQIILSHEHTDFDALASMFAASLVFPDALPVLPRQLNRNVASFLTLYRNHFPFITDKDLPRADVTHAILVDARTVNWVKGMDAKTPQTIIDHHADDETPAPHQRLWYAAVGANTTLLVEKLMEQSMTLSSLHATLLALGIHEDTGSLTYASTTFRDARALSWLLEPERGVNLGVLSQFLNHPLSRPQRDLLQKLIDHSEFVEVAGHTVVIAEAEAVGFREELSALASRLRDFHETDAIFMVVDLGDIIQVVGSQRFSVSTKASPLDVYRAARSVNPSPYMFLLELDGFSLVGASPEIHVRCEDNKVEIRPIAGTRRRGKTADEDAALEKELLADPKERAEHVMLVDLARNDIGRVCDFGSVQVKDLMIIERYSHVMHIVSSVEGKLSADKTNYDLMRATFPAGTVSGAPKIRAMQIIADLEGTTRGPYGGCVGYFSFNGNLDTCITIRTALLKDGKAYVQAGGGWVNDSEPEAEFQETVNKSKAMLKAVALAETFAKTA